MKSLFHLLLLFVFFSTAAIGAETGPAPAENLSLLIDAALANNPELKSSQARWQMFTSKARQASSLEDPMIMFKLQNLLVRDPLSFGGKDPQTAKVIGISQQLPFWGKRALREEVANYEAESYRWQIEERKLELKRMVKEIFYQIYAIDKALEVVSRSHQIVADFVVIAESKYSVGQGVQQDIFKARLEKAKMLDMSISLEQQRRTLAANLNYLLFRHDTTPIGKIADFELPALNHSIEQLKEAAQEKRPQVKNLNILADKGRASHRLARKEFYPDFNLSFEYMFREAVVNGMSSDPGYDMFTLGLTFNLPLQRERRQAMLAESASETTMSIEELNSLKNNIHYTINDLLAQMERRRRQVELYKGGIIPQAQQSLESAIINYRVGKVDFLTLMDARVNLFSYEREMYEAKAEYMMALARLEAAIGVDLVEKQR